MSRSGMPVGGMIGVGGGPRGFRGPSPAAKIPRRFSVGIEGVSIPVSETRVSKPAPEKQKPSTEKTAKMAKKVKKVEETQGVDAALQDIADFDPNKAVVDGLAGVNGPFLNQGEIDKMLKTDLAIKTMVSANKNAKKAFAKSGESKPTEVKPTDGKTKEPAPKATDKPQTGEEKLKNTEARLKEAEEANRKMLRVLDAVAKGKSIKEAMTEEFNREETDEEKKSSWKVMLGLLIGTLITGSTQTLSEAGREADQLAQRS